MQGLEMAGESSMKSYTYLKRKKKRKKQEYIHEFSNITSNFNFN
jgi:hypothetical protein